MLEKVIIVGAGPAGIGIAVTLRKMNIPFVVLEREDIGASLVKWPEEMKFISPSFTGNFFGIPDLNAITPDSSPAYTLQTEHPTGKQYTQYLNKIAKHYELPIKKNCEVFNISKKDNIFHIETNKELLKSFFVIWACGEFQYPNDKPFNGAEYCIHNSKVDSWRFLKGNSFVVIGAYESGIDAACNLAALNKQVKVLDANDELSNQISDSSYSLAPFTRDRLAQHKSNIKILVNSEVTFVESLDSNYIVNLSNGKKIISKTKPILATGFISSLNIINSLFHNKNGYVELTDSDESTKTSGLFLVGPQVQHNGAIFCFIYKYRQRFPIVAEAIAHRIGENNKTNKVIDEYKNMNFYFKDLSSYENFFL